MWVLRVSSQFWNIQRVCHESPVQSHSTTSGASSQWVGFRSKCQHSPDSPHNGVAPIGSLNQSREVRPLEHNSPRSLFVWVLVVVFLFGANAALMLYQAFLFHRVGGPESVVLPLLGILILRLALDLSPAWSVVPAPAWGMLGQLVMCSLQFGSSKDVEFTWTTTQSRGGPTNFAERLN